MIIRNYDGTLNGLYDIIWEVSLRITELDERLQTVEGEIMALQDLLEDNREEQ